MPAADLSTSDLSILASLPHQAVPTLSDSQANPTLSSSVILLSLWASTAVKTIRLALEAKAYKVRELLLQVVMERVAGSNPNRKKLYPSLHLLYNG